MAAANPMDASLRHSLLMTRYYVAQNVPGALQAGGFGRLYLREEATHQLFVDKTFQNHDAYLNEKNAIMEINRERSHPCIIRLIASNDMNSALSYPYFKNGSLGDLLDSHNYQPVIESDDIIAWLIDIACALEFLHQFHEVAHLDIKPDNILLNDKLDAVLTDFGYLNTLPIPFNNHYLTNDYSPPEVRMHNNMNPLFLQNHKATLDALPYKKRISKL